MTFALTFSLFTSLDAHAQSTYNTQIVADALALYKTRAHLLAALADPVEYQDAVGFVTVADERWTAIVGAQNNVPDGGLVIEGDFSALKAIVPDFVKLPQNPASSDAMEKAVDNLSAALHSTFNLPDVPDVPSNTAIDKARAGIATSLADYKAGKSDDA